MQPQYKQKYVIDHQGAFDIIGDIHGCFEELTTLLLKLGYTLDAENRFLCDHPEKRSLIFLGDLTDRDPNSPDVLALVMENVSKGRAFCVNGNHDDKLRRYLKGNNVTVSHGLEETIEQLSLKPASFSKDVYNFLESLQSHLIFDEGKLVATHAAMKEKYIGRESKGIRSFCLYGPTTGKLDKDGLPERLPWVNSYTGKALVAYGHETVKESRIENNTVNLDTGCVFGGKLTALRYPEMTFMSVPAQKQYAK